MIFHIIMSLKLYNELRSTNENREIPTAKHLRQVNQDYRKQDALW